jgi:hypothetical protein
VRPSTGSIITLGLAGLICLVSACAIRKDANPSFVIKLELMAELKESPGEIEFSVSMGNLPPQILRDSRGRFYAQPFGGYRIAVFDSTGVYQRTIGGAGYGPGELERFPAPVLCDAENRIWIWEFRSRKATIYDQDGNFVKTARLPIRPMFQLKDGSLLGIEPATAQQGYSGYPLHRFSVDGELLSSFGNVIPGYQWEQMYLYQMIGALTIDGHLIMTPIGRYGFELWDPLAERQLRTLSVKVPWFKESTEVLGDYRAVEPTDLITDLSVDESGVIWAVITTAADDWRPTRTSGDYSEVPDPTEERRMFFDWIVQAIDQDSGIVLAERRFSDQVWMLLGSTGLVTAESNEDTGNASLNIWRLVLVQSADTIDN